MKSSRRVLLACAGALAALAPTAAHAIPRDATLNLQSTETSAAGGSLSGLTVTAEGTSGTASAALTYYFEVTGIPFGTVVPIIITGDYRVDAFGTAIATGQLTTGLDLAPGDFTRDVIANCPNTACGPHTFDVHEQMIAGYEWTVLISASGAAGALGTYHSQFDPVITIDPSFALAGQAVLSFSPNLTAAAPEPSTFASMFAALLLIGARFAPWGRRSCH